ncbi:unnamed protein product [Ectocarpus fasciculatus]
MFFLSLGLPIRQLVFDPLETSDPRVSEVLAKRREGDIGPESTTTPCSTSMVGSEFSGVNTLALWTYEKVEAMPSVSAAFDEFSRKALCQESIFFLKDVAKFQCDGHRDAVDIGGGDDGVGGNKFADFTELVLRYIVDGAPDEVNISSGSKVAIVGVYEAGQLAFYGLPARERRFSSQTRTRRSPSCWRAI